MSRALLRSLRHVRPTTPRLLLAPRHSSTFEQTPSPPRLPADQQAEFERLQRAAEARLSSHTQQQQQQQPPPPSPRATSRHGTEPAQPEAAAATAAAAQPSTVAAGTLSGGIRKGAPPEFDGEVNPSTGEVGGPKNEPLRWGGEGDWSYNGRVTDF